MARQRRDPWHDALDAQIALWKWYRTAEGRRWMVGSLRANVKGHSEYLHELLLRLYDAEMGRLIDCDPIYVSEEMCEVVEAARESFQPEPLLETDLITPRGFLWWHKPLVLSDKYENPLAVHAMSWARSYTSDTEQGALQVMAEINDESRIQALGDRVTADEMEKFIEEGRVTAAGINVTLYADRDHYLNISQSPDNTMPEGWEKPPHWAWDDTHAVPVVPFHLTPWHYNQEFAGNEVDEQGQPTGAWDWWSMAQVTFRLMQQRIAVKHFNRPSRAVRRESKRIGHPEDREIVVIRLRREASEASEPTGQPANYSHRFIVGGHWRNQPYPSEGIHRQIWIDDYIKGDEHLPLIVRPRRVWKWDR